MPSVDDREGLEALRCNLRAMIGPADGITASSAPQITNVGTDPATSRNVRPAGLPL